jgi:hypothetical protein
LNVNPPLRSRHLPAEFNTPDRLEKDLDVARKLAKHLDVESGIHAMDDGGSAAGLDAVEARLEDVILMGEGYVDHGVSAEHMRDDEEVGLMGEQEKEQQQPVQPTEDSVAVKKVMYTYIYIYNFCCFCGSC